LNPNQRYIGSEKQSIFESFVDQFFEEFHNLSHKELLELKQATEYENTNYYEKRQRAVGTRSSRKAGGNGSYTIVAPLNTGRDRASQRHLIDQYEEEHFEEGAKILAKLDALDLLLNRPSSQEKKH
jgi:hypothetical protein